MRGSSSARTIAVLGAGAWGTALAMQLARNGHRTLLWGRRREAIEAMRASGRNDRYIPDVSFPAGLEPQWCLTEVLDETSTFLLAVPSGAFREMLRTIARSAVRDPHLIWATKGLATHAGKLLHTVAEEELDASIARGLLSGPSFASEVARGLPTAVTIASSDENFAREAASWLHGDAFRVYVSVDVVGVELGGALKNVLAIAAGISDGLGFGSNARAALVTRGLSEMMRLAEAAGAQRETLMGLSGLGDLVLTCTDDQSRNRRVGLAIGRGLRLDAAVREVGQTVEGVATAGAVLQMAGAHGIEMPICAQVARVLFKGLEPRAAVIELLNRERKMEIVNCEAP